MYSAVISTRGRNPINRTVISTRGRNPTNSAVSNIITTLIAFKSLPAWQVGFFCYDIFGNKTSHFHCISNLSGIIYSLKKKNPFWTYMTFQFSDVILFFLWMHLPFCLLPFFSDPVRTFQLFLFPSR